MTDSVVVTVEPSSAVVVVVVVVLVVVVLVLVVVVVLVVVTEVDRDSAVVVWVEVDEAVVDESSVDVAVVSCSAGGAEEPASGAAAGWPALAGVAAVCSTGALGGGSSARAVSAARARPAYTPAPRTPAASVRRHQDLPTAGSARPSSVPGWRFMLRKLGTGPSRPVGPRVRPNLDPVCPGSHPIG
ncbi:hypothetical protein [Candidatus Blastococcus massiliensis]|uniref:hypothetical protein n=1 Tax=Candidatus Blastococcus massiliensis TaxID=1470358 RepID=UPI000590546D|nr:hypothetical protein [Candidatus Blastococcus massiliensis]